MIDWNRNKKIDPVDIGISIAVDSYTSGSLNLINYSFTLIQEVIPEHNTKGQIRQYMPHVLYSKRQTSKLHKYGMGPFCRFSISRTWCGISGVYALYNNHHLLYIGQCKDFAQRFNMGYGIISPRNCYVGGQVTNCKINAMILKEYLDGKKIYLYFYETIDYERVEQKLINGLNPPYNGRV